MLVFIVMIMTCVCWDDLVLILIVIDNDLCFQRSLGVSAYSD